VSVVDRESDRNIIIAIIAGESSGDQLGARLIASLKELSDQQIQFIGVGGPLMEEQGLASFFPMSDIAVNGIFPVIARLPTLISRIKMTVHFVAKAKPDIVVHIDAQDFNQRVAKKLKRLIPETPLIGYVSPTVWAWRPGRAKKIKKLFNKLLAVLPFEPEVHRKLGGPETIYVGHPLLERVKDWTRSPEEEAGLLNKPQRLLILPGSRESEARKLLPLFKGAVEALDSSYPELEIILPVVDHLAELIQSLTKDWPIQPKLLSGEKEKWAAFRTASAALAASGTVTLELALAKVPTIVTYRVSHLEELAGRLLITSKFASLPNIIIDQPLLPEFLDRKWSGRELALLLQKLMKDGSERNQQLLGFEKVHQLMRSKNIDKPSEMAAKLILTEIKTK
jgi:lipid-A-disaccharide synthase